MGLDDVEDDGSPELGGVEYGRYCAAWDGWIWDRIGRIVRRGRSDIFVIGVL
jgi:hypothetical protein